MALHDLDDLVDRGPIGAAIDDLFYGDPDLLLRELVSAPVVALGLANRFVESIRSRPARRRIQM
jgi:hypothetical protein